MLLKAVPQASQVHTEQLQFVDIYHAKPGDYRSATQRIYRETGHASSLSLPVMKGGGCPVGAEDGKHP